MVVEVDGSTVRVDYSSVPDAAAGPINCAAALDGLGEPDRDRDARRRRRGAERGPLPADRGGRRGRARCSIRCRRRRASSTRWPTFQAIEAIYNAIAKALPSAVPACCGGDIAALVWWGVARERPASPGPTGSPHPIGQGALGARRRREQPDPPRRGGDALLADRGVGGEEPVAAREGRAGAGLRAGRASTAAASASTSSSTRSRTATSPSAVERTKNAPWGLEGGGFGASERRRAGARRTGAASSSARRRGCAFPKGCDARAVHAAEAAATASLRSAIPRRCGATCARATSASSTRGRTTRTRSPPTRSGSGSAAPGRGSAARRRSAPRRGDR